MRSRDRVCCPSVLLRRRPARGLLGGMMEVPSTDWREGGVGEVEIRATAPVAAEWRRLPGSTRHGFTHFELELEVLAAECDGGAAVEGVWCPLHRLDDHALPTAMKKVIAHALTSGG